LAKLCATFAVNFIINMKSFYAIISILILSLSAQAQIKNPVRWEYSAKKISPTVYELHIKASIDPGWHLYTIDHSADIGVATSLTFNNNPLGSLTGKIKAIGKPISMKDPSTGDLVKFYEKSVDIVQVVTLKAAVKTNYTGSVEFMVCDDKQCLPPTTKTFSIALQ
jgi:DsbC/DsbD-like thiol-disulfide interchange protein